MCQLCDEFKIIPFELSGTPASLCLDEDNPQYLLLHLENFNQTKKTMTKPIKINYCFVCGKDLSKL